MLTSAGLQPVEELLSQCYLIGGVNPWHE